MKVAVIGSRNLRVKGLEQYLPKGTDCIVSGGAVGVDSSAAEFAKKAGLCLKVFLPDYEQWGRRAPLMRNLDIVAEADIVLAFWNGRSKGTEFVINQCRKQGKPIKVFLPKEGQEGAFVLMPLAQQLSFE